MEKPLSLIINDFKKDLNNTIINSQLPVCIIEPILKDTYNQIYEILNKLLINDEQIYLDSLNHEEIEKNNQKDLNE